ncbi:hypothetical protein AGMMS49938_10480 [Fibrobacterales bacterium]|nr:hypothetical protein AGMMS49938_10480 [Fibrobacterales bacterium]
MSEENGELVENGDFSKGISGWNIGCWKGKFSADDNFDDEVSFNIVEPGTEAWALQFYRTVALKEGESYIFSMKAKAEQPRTLNVNIKKHKEDYVPYANGRIIDLSTEWQDYSWRFTMKDASDSAALLSFDMGGNGTGWSLKDVSLQLSNGESVKGNFSRRIQKNSGYFNSPSEPWELRFYSAGGELLEVLDKGQGGEGMRAYPRIDRSGIIVVKEIKK